METTLPERSEVNTAPIATDDDFGVRPGRTTVLPVLDNDSDRRRRRADRDPSPAATRRSARSSRSTTARALQIAVPENAIGRRRPSRTRSTTAAAAPTPRRATLDRARLGRQRRAEAEARHDRGRRGRRRRVVQRAARLDRPRRRRRLPAGRRAAPRATRRTSPSDGRITYRAIAGDPGPQGRRRSSSPTATKVTDGHRPLRCAPARLHRPGHQRRPRRRARRPVVTVAPLANDTSSGSEALRLTRVDEVPGATITPDFANKTFSFSSDVPGTYYVQYLVAAGPNAVPGLVRVDVRPEADTDLPPVAVRDVALLPSGGEVLVNVLVERLRSRRAASSSCSRSRSEPVQRHLGGGPEPRDAPHQRPVRPRRRRCASRTASRTARRPREGEVVVIPVPAPSQLRPPVANDDQVVVRAGDVVTIPVLENDYHPNGDTIHVAPDLVPPLVEPEQGEMFVSQDTLRFRASDRARHGLRHLRGRRQHRPGGRRIRHDPGAAGQPRDEHRARVRATSPRGC